MKEKESVRQRKAIENTQRLLALAAAKEYCEKNGLSYEKLKKQNFVLVYETAWFSQPSEVVPIGLTNDMDTLPYPTLVFRTKNDNLLIEETEHTRKYLAQ